MTDTDSDWSQQVLRFWFEELTKKDWFISTQALDEIIAERFVSIHTQLSQQRELAGDANHDTALASIIVLDQFSRNMFRGSKKAFAFDALSLTLAKQALARRLDEKLDDDHKQFLYMPFMHAENLEDQNTCVTLLTAIGRPEPAIEHRGIVEKFGRFPHRNEVLGRASTTDEIAYLKDGRRFGQ